MVPSAQSILGIRNSPPWSTGFVLTSACMKDPCASRSSRFVIGAVQRPVSMRVGLPSHSYHASGFVRPAQANSVPESPPLGSWK